MTLRHFANEQPDTPASWVLSELELAVLDMAAANWKKLPNNPTILQLSSAIAALGGHLKRNGPPGWITLTGTPAAFLPSLIAPGLDCR